MWLQRLGSRMRQEREATESPDEFDQGVIHQAAMPRHGIACRCLDDLLGSIGGADECRSDRDDGSHYANPSTRREPATGVRLRS
jgi:hypothetical protein